MKKLLIITTTMLLGCTSATKDEQPLTTDYKHHSFGNGKITVEEFTLDGHQYLVSFHGGMLHKYGCNHPEHKIKQ